MPRLSSRRSWPSPRSNHPGLRLLRSVWTLPTNLLGHLAGIVVSGQMPKRVGGSAAIGWMYPIRRGIGLDFVAAVTLGHAILYREDALFGRRGRAVLAHELAHTRQHDWLGPLYLPLHIVAQSCSAVLSTILPGRPRSRVHDYNPLEHTFICLGAEACYELVEGGLGPEEVEAYLAQFGC